MTRLLSFGKMKGFVAFLQGTELIVEIKNPNPMPSYIFSLGLRFFIFF